MYTFTTTVWVYPGQAAWHFVNVPIGISKSIDERYSHLKAGFGSLKVQVSIGTTTWRTSIFPDKKHACYLLPIKASVRQAEYIADKSKIRVELLILE